MAVKLLDAETSVGVSPSWTVRMKPRNHSGQIIVTGAPTAVTVDIEGSLDGKTWASLASHVLSAGELTAGLALFHIVDKPVRYIRANILSITGGTAPTVTVLYEGETA